MISLMQNPRYRCDYYLCPYVIAIKGLRASYLLDPVILVTKKEGICFKAIALFFEIKSGNFVPLFFIKELPFSTKHLQLVEA